MRWIFLPEALELVGQSLGPAKQVFVLLQHGTKDEAQRAKEALDHPSDQIVIGSVRGHTPGQMIPGDVVVIGPGVPTIEQDATGAVHRVDSMADVPKVKIAMPAPPSQFHLERLVEAYWAGKVKVRKRNAEMLRPEQHPRINWHTGTVGNVPLEIDRESLIRAFPVADQSPAQPESRQRELKRDGEALAECEFPPTVPARSLPKHRRANTANVETWFRARIAEAIEKGDRLTCAGLSRTAQSELSPGLRDLIRSLWENPDGPVPPNWHRRGPRRGQ